MIRPHFSTELASFNAKGGKLFTYINFIGRNRLTPPIPPTPIVKHSGTFLFHMVNAKNHTQGTEGWGVRVGTGGGGGDGGWGWGRGQGGGTE
jgi:hypothetical protein